MKLFLDMCCYNRPYDPQEQLRVNLETQAKLYIQEQIKQGYVDLVSSYTLDFEVSNVPQSERRDAIRRFIRDYSVEYIGPDSHLAVEAKAKTIILTGIKEKDASHVACAILCGCDCFITTDRRLLKYRTSEIRLLNPIEFIMEKEGMS